MAIMFSLRTRITLSSCESDQDELSISHDHSTMAPSIPETRQSLILRLPDHQDVEAWDLFVEIYEPLVYRLARSRGFQDADAREVVQEVMIAVARAVDRWKPDEQRGRFRDWLYRIARNLLINHLTRRKHRPIGTGDSGIDDLLNNQVRDHSSQTAVFDMEYRREIFRWAAAQVRLRVAPKTWQAFRRTSIDGMPVPTVAADLGMTSGAVRIARSRVLGRLRRTVQTFEESSPARNSHE